MYFIENWKKIPLRLMYKKDSKKDKKDSQINTPDKYQTFEKVIFNINFVVIVYIPYNGIDVLT